jgi:hypothetical protein
VSINKTIHEFWRDWAALVYLFICMIDFFIAPLLWNIGMTLMDKDVQMNTSRWMPLTLGAGAMFHLSFGAILGATAWKKKDELEIHNNRTDTSNN